MVVREIHADNTNRFPPSVTAAPTTRKKDENQFYYATVSETDETDSRNKPVSLARTYGSK